MNLTFLRRSRQKNRVMDRALAWSSALNSVEQENGLGAGATSATTVDEMRCKLRTSIEAYGQGYFDFGDVIKDNAVVNCRVLGSRHSAIETLPKGGIIGEVGTQTGQFADHIYHTAQPSRLHLFDLSLEWFDKSVLVDPIQQGDVQIHLGDSSTELGKFPNEHFDWLYIDGDHSYGGITRDIAQAVRTVKREGVLVFNDYTVWSPLEVCNYGVLKAVNELVNGGEWEFLYLALHPWGYHDVALRRRGGGSNS
jgi:hypothetical protein